MSRGNSRTTRRLTGMRRWDGRLRITTDWFSYHKDPDLNFMDGNLLVFLREPGSSRRGASFRLHAEYLRAIGFLSIVDHSGTPSLPIHWMMHGRANGQINTTVHKLYLPAPADADDDDAEQYHLATRNFFAWLYDRPLTGYTLGTSLVELMGRAQLYRPKDAQKDIVAYMNRRGYLDFRECVDHALAVLHLAESFHMEALWVNAFAHCVGMNHSLHASIEFDAISCPTKAKITRARLEMDIRLDRVAKSMTTFFDSEISGFYVGLSQAAKDHMDSFRSFLHAYYIEKHGFWPPSGFASSFVLRRSLYRSMYMDFRALYHYLVDSGSTPSSQRSKPLEGGICTLQMVRAFDSRHGLETLPHPLPLLPRLPGSSAGFGFTIRNRRKGRGARHITSMMSLTEASNQHTDLMKCRLVWNYVQFEKQTAADDLDPFSLAEGRKVRWILIYDIFQLLASVISAPKEVIDTEGVSYPLCCQRPKTMPWEVKAEDCTGVASSAGMSMGLSCIEDDGPYDSKQELQPDIDHTTSPHARSSTSSANASSAADSRSMSSPTSSPSTAIVAKSAHYPSPLHLFQKQGASLADVATPSSSALTARRKRAPFHEIIICRYGNGLKLSVDETPKVTGTIRSREIGHSYPQGPFKPNINNSIFFSKTATPPSSTNQPPSSRPKPPLLVLHSPKSTPPPLRSSSPPSPTLPDSPTVPTLSTTSSTSRPSSFNSASSHPTSNSSQREAEQIDNKSNKSTDTVITTIAIGATPMPSLSSRPPEPSKIPAKRYPSTRAPARQSPQISPKAQPSVSVPRTSTVSAAPRKSLPWLASSTGLGRIELPTAFLRAYSNRKLQTTSG